MPNSTHQIGSDSDLLDLVRRNPRAGWNCFLERYAGFIFRHLQRIGLDYDETMERFVYICSKLAEGNCRRLREVRHLGRDDELVPWIRTVTERFAVSWLWSKRGRDRLPNAIGELDPMDQRVFDLHFRVGLKPSAILERLQTEGLDPVSPADVFESLERVLSRLSENRRWKLLGRLLSRQKAESLTSLAIGSRAWEPEETVPDAESILLKKEQKQKLEDLLGRLSDRSRLILQLRTEEGLAYNEISRALGISQSSARRHFADAIAQLRNLWFDASSQLSALSQEAP